MKKIELLAPAGSKEALVAAINNGADAVYLGGSKFGARAYASNFNNEEMIEAIKLAHRYHVSVYVTVNTLIYDEEFHQVMEYIEFLYKNDVDALLIQDFGLLSRVSSLYPNLPLHASTQMHIHNIDGIKALQKMGVKRVVLAREVSIDEIKKIHKAVPYMELEVFTYGALCISYSGQCLFSSMIGERSGNRGECAQACRLPYSLIIEENGIQSVIKTKGQYLLSPKDLNTLDNLGELIEAGVSSLKIEGRMKRSEYVALVVSTYKDAINDYLQNKVYHTSLEKLEELKKMFNRGFTQGHAFKVFGSDLMAQERPNHQGVEVGVVTYINAGANRVGIKLSSALSQGDGIRFLGEDDEGFSLNFLYKDTMLVKEALGGDNVEIEYRNNHSIKENSKVIKTTDIRLIDALRKQTLNLKQRYPLTLEFSAFVGKKAALVAKYQNLIAMVESENEVEAAINNSLSEDKLRQSLSKLKETPYYLDELIFNTDHHVIMSMSQINNMRRNVIEELMLKSEKRYVRPDALISKASMQVDDSNEISISCSVYTLEQLKACLELGISTIYVLDEGLHLAYPSTILSSRRVNEDDYKYNGSALLCKEMGAINQCLENNIAMYIDAEMNTLNTFSALAYSMYKPKRITLSTELTLKRILMINEHTKKRLPLEVIVYGRLELMLLKHCVINANTCDTKKVDCMMCRGNKKFYLKDRKEETYQILSDSKCFNHLLHCRTIVAIDLMGKMLDEGLRYYRLNFTNESYEKTKEVIKNYQLALARHTTNLSIEDGILGYLGK